MPTNRGRGGRWQSHRRDQRDSVPAADGLPWRDLPPCFGSWKTVQDRHRRWSADARGRGSCGLSKPMPTPRAGSAGAWSASIPRPAALITTRLVHPRVPPRSRVGAGVRHVIVPMRPWDAREADSQASSTLPGKAGVARSALSSRPASGGGRTTHDSRPGRDLCAPAGWWTTAHSARPRRGR
ncbi:transposase [Streptomyces chartreusis]|uniref:transposase n=1 Tax=Streptomyces chartreusis TaxID=1969 RepID=UPI003641A678